MDANSLSHVVADASIWLASAAAALTAIVLLAVEVGRNRQPGGVVFRPNSPDSAEIPSGPMQDLPRPTTPRPKDQPKPLRQGYRHCSCAAGQHPAEGYQPCAPAETPVPPSVDPDDTLRVNTNEIWQPAGLDGVYRPGTHGK